jgi:protoheme IX farnesyltransferase
VGKEQQAAPQCLVARAESATAIRTLQEYFRLTKPRIALLIIISTAVGYCYGTISAFSFFRFVHALLGTALMAAGSATLNQWYEQGIDAQMKRTRRRPIPAGTVQSHHALLFGITLSLLGILELWTFANVLAAVLGLVTSVA